MNLSVWYKKIPLVVEVLDFLLSFYWAIFEKNYSIATYFLLLGLWLRFDRRLDEVSKQVH